jgi:hypothetical protein
MIKKLTELNINGNRLMKLKLLKSDLLERKISAMIKKATTPKVQVQVNSFNHFKVSFT